MTVNPAIMLGLRDFSVFPHIPLSQAVVNDAETNPLIKPSEDPLRAANPVF